MAKILDKINKIRTAILGKEVRGALADGLEAVNKETESTTEKQKHLEDTFDQLVIDAGNSNAEVVDARVDKTNNKTYGKIGDRMDEVSSKLAHNTKLMNQLYVDVEDFGANIENDSTIQIQKAIDYINNQGGGTVLLRKIYKISKINIKPNVRLLGYSNISSGLVKINPSVADDFQHLIQIGVNENEEVNRYKNIVLENLKIDGGRINESNHSQTNHGILITNADRIKILDCNIINNHSDGVWIGFNRPSDIVIQRNKFENNGRVSCVVDTTDYGVRILDNIFEGGYALDIEQDGMDISSGSKGIIIDGNTFENCNHISIVTPENVINERYSANHTFTNNIFYNCSNEKDDLFTLTSFNLIFEKNKFYNCSAKRYFFYCLNVHKLLFNSNIFSGCEFGDDFFYFYQQENLGTKEVIISNNIIYALAKNPSSKDGIAIFYCNSNSLGFNNAILSGNSITTNCKYFSYGDLWRENSICSGNAITTVYVDTAICFYTVEAGSHFSLLANALKGFDYAIMTFHSSEYNYQKISHNKTNSQMIHESFELDNNKTFVMKKNGIRYEIFLDESGSLQTRSLPETKPAIKE